MITIPIFADRTVAVLGLGKSGISAARALMAGGARVLAWDDDPGMRDRAAALGVPIHDLSTMDWTDCFTLVLSPGIPLNFPAPNPVVETARAQDCEIVSDIELLHRAHSQTRFVGITGTNGKSTTTVLLGHILEQADVDVQVGGNLGTAALDLEPLGTEGAYVLELSSYQLDLCPTTVMDIAVLLNIAPDHLDRHGGMDGYIAAKKQIIRNQLNHHTAIIGVDDAVCRGIFKGIQAEKHQQVIGISGTGAVPRGVYAVDGILTDDTDGQATAVLDLDDVPNLPGTHNHQNAAAAFTAAKALGVPVDKIIRGMRSYPGLVHRQERIGVMAGVAFVNDSKATNPEATAKALMSYEDIYWIAGGRAKDGGFEVLKPHLDNVRHAYLIGEAAAELQTVFGQILECHVAGNIEKATDYAFDQAVRDGTARPTVLLSPACASFDQFRNFEVRGEYFRQCVSALSLRQGNIVFENSIVAGGFA